MQYSREFMQRVAGDDRPTDDDYLNNVQAYLSQPGETATPEDVAYELGFEDGYRLRQDEALHALLSDPERLAELTATLREYGLQLTEAGTAELIRP